MKSTMRTEEETISRKQKTASVEVKENNVSEGEEWPGKIDDM